MRRSRGRQSADLREARKRKLGTYPTEMWRIVATASEGKNYNRRFMLHAEACAFIMRFNRFRSDAIECRAAGALYLRDVMVTGEDATGERFHTTRRDAPGPFDITWKYIGDQEDFAHAQRLENEEGHAGGQITREDVKGVDETLELLNKLNLELGGATATEKERASREAFRRNLKSDDASERTVESWLGEQLSGQQFTPCQHEWDVTETRCFKCGEPKP